jgi:hypothetical protein
MRLLPLAALRRDREQVLCLQCKYFLQIMLGSFRTKADSRHSRMLLNANLYNNVRQQGLLVFIRFNQEPIFFVTFYNHLFFNKDSAPSVSEGKP